MKEGSIVHMKCTKAAENNCFLNKERNKLVAQPVYFPLCNRFKIAPFLKVTFLTAFAMKGAIHLAKIWQIIYCK